MKTLQLLPVIMLAASCSIMPAERIYLSTGGNDINSGSVSEPLQSPEAARKAVARIRLEKPGRDIRVIFAGGTWYLAKPLLFTSGDGGSGKHSVTWEGAPGGKTIFSGGRPITGFHDAGYGIWWANVDSALYFEQLYIDGIRATRARTPNLTDTLPRMYLTKSRWVYLPDSTVQNITVEVRDRGYFANKQPLGDFEMVVFKDWTTSRFRATGLNAEKSEVYLKPPFALYDGPYNSIFAGSANRYSCFLEGDPAFLDEAGEWALDRKAHRLYYKPLPGQTPDKITAIAAVADQLLSIEGGKDAPVKNLIFKDIRFENAAYLLPGFNHDGMQAGFYYPEKSDPGGRPGLIPPVIKIQYAENCSMTGCEVSNSGGNGIYLMEGCRGNHLDGVVLEDIGASGIMVGLTYDPGEGSSLLPLDNIITSCTVHKAGVLFQGAIGIWLGFCAETEISGCEVSDLPYTGISVGWQWNPLPSSSRNNRILNNRIHHAMQILGDGGGIYTLGWQPGSVIEGNDIHDILRSKLNHASDNNGIFMDEGSKGYLVKNNTIRSTAHTCIRGHRASGNELTGNTFYYGTTAAISQSPPYDKMIFANSDTTIRWKNPGFPKELGYPDNVTAFTMHGNRFLK